MEVEDGGMVHMETREPRQDPDLVTMEVLLTVEVLHCFLAIYIIYESFATVGEIRVYLRADFQSGSRVLKKVF